MNQKPNPDENKNEAAPKTNEDADTALNSEIREEEKDADEEWEEVKDKTSGVDKELEEKLEKGTAEPGDLENMGG